MAVALGVGVEDGRVQAQRPRRVDRVHPVDLVDRLAAHDAPPAVASLEEVVKPPGADDVDQHIVHEAPLADRHLRLGDRPGLHNVDRHAAQEVTDLYPLGGSLAAGLDEVLIRALEPGGVHPGAVVPDRGEPFPVPAVAVQRPVLDQVADQQSVFWIAHGLGLRLAGDACTLSLALVVRRLVYGPSSRRSTESLDGVASGGPANRVTAVPVVIASAK
jgi:hypothetical protein